MVNTAILSIVILVVLFKIYSLLVPTAMDTGDELNTSNQCATQGGYWNTTGTAFCAVESSNETVLPYNSIPFSTLFSGSGVVFIVIMAALVIVVVKSFMSGK